MAVVMKISADIFSFAQPLRVCSLASKWCYCKLLGYGTKKRVFWTQLQSIYDAYRTALLAF